MPELELLYTFSGSHPVQNSYNDRVEYVVTHNLGKRPMKFELEMHRDVDGLLEYTTYSPKLSQVSNRGAFFVSEIGPQDLTLVIYKAGLTYNTEDFTFRIFG